jgi:hypothetical protein
MNNRVKQIVKRGHWIYGGTVKSEVWIIKQNYFEGPAITDEDPTPGYPPTDENGMFYYAAYAQQDTIKGVSNVRGSADEAMHLAEQTIQSKIDWEPK